MQTIQNIVFEKVEFEIATNPFLSSTNPNMIAGIPGNPFWIEVANNSDTAIYLKLFIQLRTASTAVDDTQKKIFSFMGVLPPHSFVNLDKTHLPENYRKYDHTFLVPDAEHGLTCYVIISDEVGNAELRDFHLVGKEPPSTALH
jgi:hypothetical protein